MNKNNKTVSENNWACMSIEEAHRRLTVAGGLFEIQEIEIAGQLQKVWANVPATLVDIFRHAMSFSDREFIVFGEERITYSAFAKASIHLAIHLQSLGVKKGDRVAIVMSNFPEWVVAFYAGALVGAIVTPLNGWWTGQELQYGLADSGSSVAIVDLQRLERIRPYLNDCPELKHILLTRAAHLEELTSGQQLQQLEEVIGPPQDWAALAEQPIPDVALDTDDEATILYTSGTTGKPKGALASHRNLCSSIASSALPSMRSLLRSGAELPKPGTVMPQRVNLLAVPLFHATGLTSQLINGMNAGSKIVMMPKWDVEQAVKLIEREKVMAAGGVPTLAWQLVDRARQGDCDLSSLTVISFGGAPAAPELLAAIQEMFPNAQPFSGWGMTETSASFTTINSYEYLANPASTGPAVPVSSMEIRDPADGVTVLPIGQVGEIWARGPQIVKGYWNNPKATEETFVDGWLRTGDLGRIDEQGLLYIVDRAKDMLIRGGENIYCLEVESVLYEHPDIIDAALVGLPHRTLGEEPAAVVYARQGSRVSEAELQALVAEKLAAFKVPVNVMFWPELLPRNANGKIIKAELREAVQKEYQ